MKKVHEVNDLLTYLQETTGLGFIDQETSIQQSYQRALANKSGVTIKVLTIIGEFLANVFFLGFLFLIDVADSSPAMILLGIAFIGLSVFLSRKLDHLFLDTLAVTIYASGISLLIWGMEMGGAGDKAVCLLMMVTGIISLVLFDNYILVFLSAMLVTGSLFCLIMTSRAEFLAPIYGAMLAIAFTAWLKLEAVMITTRVKLSRLYSPVRLALLCSLLGICYFLSTGFWFEMHSLHFLLIPSVAIAAAIVFGLTSILKTLQLTQPRQRTLAYATVALLLLPTMYAPAISGALLVMTWCFLVNYKTGFVLGIIGLIYFTGQYYYYLQFTLLTKSLLMMASGALFIILYLLLHQSFRQHEKV